MEIQNEYCNQFAFRSTREARESRDNLIRLGYRIRACASGVLRTWDPVRPGLAGAWTEGLTAARFEPALIAVYGSLLKGLHNHDRLRGAELVAEDLLVGAELVDLGSFPGMRRVKSRAKRVRVEIYSVGEHAFMACDRLEGHPSFYKREPVRTLGRWQPQVYVWQERENHGYGGRQVVEGGDWRAYYRKKMRLDEEAAAGWQLEDSWEEEFV